MNETGIPDPTYYIHDEIMGVGTVVRRANPRPDWGGQAAQSLGLYTYRQMCELLACSQSVANPEVPVA